MLQLHPEHRRLHGIEAAVPANLLVVIPLAASVIAQAANVRRQFLVVGGDASAIAIGAQVLGGIKAESGSLAQRSRFLLAPFGAEGLRRIFDKAGVVLLGESERLMSESEAARRELAELGAQRGQVAITFGDVTARLKGLETEIAELQLGIGAAREQEAATMRQGDQLRGERAALEGRRSSLDGLIREHSYSTDTVRNIFKANTLNGGSNGLSPVGTLADFLEVDGQYEGVVDEFLRDELNYVVVKSWDAADAGVRMLESDVAGRATFLVHGEKEAHAALHPTHGDGTAMNGAPSSVEGAVALKDCVRVLNGFGSSLEGMLPKLRDGFIANDTATARRLASEHPRGFFLSPSGEAFHNATVTGGRVREQGPLALKRELSEIQQKLDAVEAE